jgi:acyl-CoA thioester hydrolase
MNAREEQLLDNYNLDVFENMQTTGNTWVVKSNQVQYLSPVNMGETVVIESQLNHFSGTGLLVEMKMWNNTKITLRSIIWVRFTYYNIKSKKVCQHDSDLVRLFKSIVNPIHTSTFEQRCDEIRKQI